MAELEAKHLQEKLEQQEKTLNDGTARSEERLHAAEAMIESLKSVQDALEREKADLHNQAEQLDEELIQTRTEMLEIKGQLEV